ncbi:allantoinase [Kineococcus radiotolerans]|uniref:allantoinase n=1 Tax=Kineococcus radiotolerans TaxID=131568 RepID=A0A7W4TI24_KINRA|nr:allantoinase AllB [Kineococcus radiotolerans]MBB2899319.1 allantoinase [Kineococcus radiotolerans]
MLTGTGVEDGVEDVVEDVVDGGSGDVVPAGSGPRVDVVLRAGRAVVDGATRAVSVAVREGRIVAVEAFEHPWAAVREVVLAADEVLLPGLVDTHVHVNEPGRTEWEGFASATRAAAAGGITTILDMPLNSVPATLDPAALAVKRAAAAGQCAVDVGFWGGAVPDNADQLAPLHAAGVFGVKCFLLDSGVAEFPPLDAGGLAVALAELARFDGLLLAHAEDAEEIDAHVHPGGRSFADFVASRPPSAEARAVRALAEATARAGARAHVVHLSSAAGLAEVAAAKAAGTRLSAETCPHYLTLDAGAVPDGDTSFKCCPPIRDRAEQDALWAGLLDGTIDCVVSDHSPCTVELKRLEEGDFGIAWGGIASVQLGLPAVWTAARSRGVGLETVVGWMASATADLAGLRDRGRIAVGNVADFAVFAPEEEWVVDARSLHHRNAVTPYEGRRFTGAVRSTWLRGNRIDLEGEPRGELLHAPARERP